ncbi:ESX secretion-associated protein EspG [Nocardia grenadensis]|uniref:ESX secretion-associated protein EspG n=1 Tax=Nocardia grenadensis TaxID=931537 RepID=UPI0007A4433D|nr:ESX secretion-associated protein EspG [Nocardia grenadensis]
MPTVTNDGLLAVSELLGIQALPFVLGVGPRQDTVEAWHAARQEAYGELRAAGLIDTYDEVETELATAVRVLAQPDRELVARIHTETGTIRVCLARRGFEHAWATRSGSVFDIRTVWADENGAVLARPLLKVLGPCSPAPVAGFSALADELCVRFDGAKTSSDFAQALYTLGVADQGDAIEFGLAMSTCHAHAEIVAYAHRDGVTTQSSGAVAVYDTSRGRIVAGPGTDTDLRVWSTFTSGSDHRIGQAVSGLIESLPGGRWMP